MSQYKTKEEEEFAPEVSQWLLSLSETQGKSIDEYTGILVGMAEELIKREFHTLSGFVGKAILLLKEYPDNAKEVFEGMSYAVLGKWSKVADYGQILADIDDVRELLGEVGMKSSI
jgi:hypothetical protein